MKNGFFMKNYYLWLLAGLFVGSLTLTACGDDDEDEVVNKPEQQEQEEDVPATPGGNETSAVTFSQLKYEALPDMNVARRGHSLFVTANGDIVAVGGHTTNFDLTATAERLAGSGWESLSVPAAHDGSARTPLPDGRVLISGGMGSRIGVGQSTACSVYNPDTHSFSATGSLKTKRAFCTGVATGQGNSVLVSGNWYNTDTAFELWDGNEWTSFGNKTVQLNDPFMASAGQGIVYVFGCRSNYGALLKASVYKVNTIDKTVETVENTGLEEYELIHGDYFNSGETKDGKFYLLGIKDKVTHLLKFNTATAKATDVVALPQSIPDVTSKLGYVSGVIVSEKNNAVYVIGGYEGSQGKPLAVVSYSLDKGKMTVYYGGDFPGCLYWGAWALEPSSGKIVITGGSVKDNYDPVKTAIRVTPF